MEAFGSWTLRLLSLLGALHVAWTWTPMRPPYNAAHSYLDAAQRPLWILEDELMKRQRADRLELDYDTTTTHATTLARLRQHRELRPPPPPPPLRIVVRPDAGRSHRMAGQYVPLRHQRAPLHRRQPRTELRRRQPQSLPIFDNAPGDNALSASSYPIFVYNGTKGELLVNTMLSAQRYPMQEPVPGQILYPPSTPMFRPKPIVERFRVPGQRQLMNLTLIPFYAHEAITLAPPIITSTAIQESSTYSSATAAPVLTSAPSPTAATTVASTSPASAPLPPAPALAPTTPLPPPYETQVPRSKRKRLPKKVKQYNAYRSPQEVVRRPTTLRSTPALAAPANHRQHQEAITTYSGQAQSLDHELLDEELEMELEEVSEEQPQPQLEEMPTSGSGSGSDSMQILYMDESHETPGDKLEGSTAGPTASTASTATTTAKRQSSRYALKREYFAFPVYTLGKLLQDPKGSHRINMGRIVHVEHSTEATSSEHSGSTWFILNSRYKGPHRNGQHKGESKYFTSKYVQSSKGGDS